MLATTEQLISLSFLDTHYQAEDYKVFILYKKTSNDGPGSS